MPKELASSDYQEYAMLEEDQEKSFEAAARPLIKWLCENVHPHHVVVVTHQDAQLLEGAANTGMIYDYLRD